MSASIKPQAGQAPLPKRTEPLLIARTLPDEELVRRALDGDGWAHEAMFRKHIGAVLGVATRLLGRADEADDVAQETFTSAFRNLSRLSSPEKLRSWLLGIAVHRVKRRQRARRLWRFIGLGEPEEPTFEALLDTPHAEIRAELQTIGRWLETLPDEERLAWMLRHVEGESLEDTADILGTSLATTKRRILATQTKLEAFLARDGART